MGFEVVLGLGLAGLAWKYLKNSLTENDIAKYSHEINKRKLEENKKLPILDKYKSFFDKLFKYELSIEQRMAIVDDSNASLAIASAGSGKSSILKGYYAFLIESCDASQSDILVFSFNRKVKEEIVNDLVEMGFKNSNVETFHSFGKSISEENGENFAIDPLANEDKHNLLNTKLIDTLIKIAEENDSQIRKRLTQFKLLCPFHSIFNLAEDEFEYNKAMKDYPYKWDAFKDSDKERPLHIPAIDGKTFVKSQEELLILNYLIACGIKVNYEKKFIGAGFDYKPDFYLPDADLWFEHFGIDKNGKSPFGKDYINEYKNKKNVHKRLHTNHFFTYSFQVQENQIIPAIDSMLKKNGLEKSYLSQNAIDINIQRFYSDTVNNLISQSIRQAKATQYTSKQIEKKYDDLPDKFRAQKFKKIFLPLAEAYETYLQRNKTNDFEDMILKATSILLSSPPKKQPKYKFILVDEFQDLSISRERFLESIIKFNTGSKLFAVGDDWQSIYRFTGSDIGAVTRFEEKFPMLKNSESGRDFAVNLIKRTYRFNDQIAKVSANFIQKNPYQVPKITEGNEKNEDDPIQFIDVEEYSTKYMLKILDHVPKSTETKSVYFLARSNFSLDKTKKNENVLFDSFEKNINWKELQDSRPDLDIKWNTIHGSKGLEKDVVIILGNDSGARGFPNWWGEDPLFSIFLPQQDNYKYAEERRVMYVAMTRTKSVNIFVYKDQQPSIFLKEIEEICNSLNIKVKKTTYRDNRIKPCPECIKFGRNGWLMIKTSNPFRKKSLGYFNVRLACNLFNPEHKNSEYFCDYTEEDAICPNCNSRGFNSLLFVKNEGPEAKIFCKNTDCNFEDDYFKYHSSKGVKGSNYLKKINRHKHISNTSITYDRRKVRESRNRNRSANIPKTSISDSPRLKKGTSISKRRVERNKQLDKHESYEESFVEGMKVSHATFGVGTIISFDVISSSDKEHKGLRKAEISFDDGYTRWLVIAYAKLKPVH